jgi:DUF971 family protein
MFLLTNFNRRPMSAPSSPVPVSFKVRKPSRVLEVEFDDGVMFSLPFELLRVFRPRPKCAAMARPGSAADRQARCGDPRHRAGRQLRRQAAVLDGHESGIFTWDYLYQLGRDQAAL